MVWIWSWNRNRNRNFTKKGTGTGTITFQKSDPEPQLFNSRTGTGTVKNSYGSTTLKQSLPLVGCGVWPAGRPPGCRPRCHGVGPHPHQSSSYLWLGVVSDRPAARVSAQVSRGRAPPSPVVFLPLVGCGVWPAGRQGVGPGVTWPGPAITSRLLLAALKVPKHENFSLAFFALREPIWANDLETDPKNPFFIIWTLISNVFGFLPHTECAVNKNKIWSLFVGLIWS